jgi:threonine/homoserine/homoserine lactone efflux protein
MDISALVALLAFMVPMCFTPGPNNVLCAAHGSRHGMRKTIPLIGGMAIGWSVLGLGIGAGAVFIEQNESVIRILSYLGAAYIAYLGYKTAMATSIEEEGDAKDVLGPQVGFVLQIVNGKAWIHFVVLMTTFGTIFGAGFGGKIALVILNLSFGFPAVLSWTAFGTLLRRIFSGEDSGIWLNRGLGLLLFLVAVWIALPHE